MPVDSVREYFQHFSVLELDYTFYRPLLMLEGEPTSNYYVLKNYAHYLKKDDRVVLKVPQEVCAVKIRQGNQTVANPHYLNSRIFQDQFYRPANTLLGAHLAGMLFEQEYQRQEDRIPLPQWYPDGTAFLKLFPGIPGIIWN